MNVLDIILAIPMAYFLWKGYKRGLIFEVASLVGIVAGCWAACRFCERVADMLDFSGEWAVLAAFFITFVAVLLLSMLLGRCVKNIFKMVKLGFIDRLAGALLGFAKAICILGVFLSYVELIDHNEELLKRDVKDCSKFYKPVHKVGNSLVASLNTYVAQRRYELEMRDEREDKGC